MTAVHRRDVSGWIIRSVIAVGLVVDAVVHLKLAHDYQLAAPGGVGEGNLFRLESTVALLAALFVLVRGSRTSYAVAAIVGLSALAAVLLTRYVALPAIGPIPAMHEPIWFFQKVLSALGEVVAGLLALVMALRPSKHQDAFRSTSDIRPRSGDSSTST